VEPIVDKFYTTRDEMYPGILDKQEQYFALPVEQRRAYLLQNADLSQYWDWKKMVEASFPQAAPYLMSATSLSNAILPQAQRQKIVAKFSPMLTSQFLAFVANGKNLTAGARMELERLYKEAGQPGGDFGKFLEALNQ